MRFSWVTILLFFSLQIEAQETLGKSFKALQENPVLKEKVFIHANKTSYSQDDVIWFKAYVADTLNHPSIHTTKLYVNLLDERGNAIFKKNVLIKNGIGLGQFELNNAISPGNYYIQGYTNYMRNFGNDYNYLQKIEVQGDSSWSIIAPVQNQYDIQVLPEGGYLLEGIENTIGIKALKNGMGCDYEGTLLSSSGESIISFKSQHSGMAKCKFLYRNDEKYSIEVFLKDTVVNIEVPQAKRKGVTLHLDNTRNNYLNIYLKTNEATLKNDAFSSYSILFHQNHRISNLFSLTRIDSLNGSIQMKKNLFFEGVNTVTLFNKQRPIAERKFFIEPQKQSDVQIKRLDFENDSISYKLVLQNPKNDLESDLSISVLPSGSKLYLEEQNIKTAFLLTSFLKGHVENPSYYFDQKNLKRLEHLELLMLTQGWTQYDLPEMIAELNPKPLYKFEYGFDLRGKLDEAVKYDSIALLRNDFQIIEKVSLKDDYSFAFTNLLLYKEDTAKVALIDTSGKIIKPKRIHFDSLKGKDIPRIKIPFGKKYSSSTKTLQREYNSSREQIAKPQGRESTLTTLGGTIALEEAIVIEKKRSKRYLERRKLIEKYKPVVFDIGRYYDIPIPELFRKYDDEFLQYLKSQGIREIGGNSLDVRFVDPASREIMVVLDGRLILNEELPGLVIRMSEIENVLVSDSGRINGKLVRRPIYQVFTKKKFGNQSIDLFNEHRVKKGYDVSKKYYSPMYTTEQSRPLNSLEIDWKPSIRTNSKGEANFRIIKNQNNNGLFLSIQGFSEKGHLISETITME